MKKVKNFLQIMWTDMVVNESYKIFGTGLFVAVLFLSAMMGWGYIMFPMLIIMCFYVFAGGVKDWWKRRGKNLWKES